MCMPIKKEGFTRVRAVDVGKPGGHYIRVGITKRAGPRGGHTKVIGKPRLYKQKI